jgi:hypothetical protein
MSQQDKSSERANNLPVQAEGEVGKGAVSHNHGGAALDKSDQPAEGSSGGAPKEVGGRGGLEPTRFGDWEKNGRCIDF